MNTVTSYRDDIYAWSREQADVLRSMSGRTDLPDNLDLENIMEEVESVGRDARVTVEGLIRLALVHLLHLAVSPASDLRIEWKIGIVNCHAEIEARCTKAMCVDIDLETIWRRALTQTRGVLTAYGDAMPIVLANTCPFTLDNFLADDFDLARAIELVGATLVHDERA